METWLADLRSLECSVISPLRVLYFSTQNIDVRAGSLKILLHVLEVMDATGDKLNLLPFCLNSQPTLLIFSHKLLSEAWRKVTLQLAWYSWNVEVCLLLYYMLLIAGSVILIHLTFFSVKVCSRCIRKGSCHSRISG